jgi:hypothetical protein
MAAPPTRNDGSPIPKIWTGSDSPPGSEYVIPGWSEYCLAARRRKYEPDPEALDPHVWLLSMGVDGVPHSSASDDMSTIGSPEELLALGSFWDHLHENEQVVRRWQAVEPELYPDAVCHGALLHSVYGTSGFQGFAFPVERRGEIQRLVGERAELLAYLTCARDGRSYSEYVLLNHDLVRGQTPKGSFRPRANYPGVWPEAGPCALSPEMDDFVLSAEQYTDMCAVQLSHLFAFKHLGLPSGATLAGNEPARIMAEHLGGVALEAFLAHPDYTRPKL